MMILPLKKADLRDRPAGAKSGSSVDYVRETAPISELIPRKHDPFFDLVKEMLRADPDRRCTASEARRMPFFTEKGRAPMKD